MLIWAIRLFSLWVIACVQSDADNIGYYGRFYWHRIRWSVEFGRQHQRLPSSLQWNWNRELYRTSFSWSASASAFYFAFIFLLPWRQRKEARHCREFKASNSYSVTGSRQCTMHINLWPSSREKSLCCLKTTEMKNKQNYRLDFVHHQPVIVSYTLGMLTTNFRICMLLFQAIWSLHFLSCADINLRVVRVVWKDLIVIKWQLANR